MPGDLRSSRPSPEFGNVPQDVIRRGDAIQPTSGAAIRREVRALFSQRCKTQAEKSGSGEWLYLGEFQGRVFQVHIIMGEIISCDTMFPLMTQQPLFGQEG
jgi:hypothetical protein